MQKVGNWFLPDSDTHFRAILEGKGNYIEEHLLKALEFVQNWEVAIDVGAHVGLCSKILAGRFKRIYAFEPAFDTFQCLIGNLCEIANVVFHQLALGETKKLVRLEDDTSKPTRVGNTGARFVQEGGEIPMVSLDSLGLDNVGFLKIDVEGYEPHVLLGAKETLKRCKPITMIEVGKAPPDRYGLPVYAPIRYLEKLGAKEVLRIKSDRVFVWGGDGGGGKEKNLHRL